MFLNFADVFLSLFQNKSDNDHSNSNLWRHIADIVNTTAWLQGSMHYLHVVESLKPSCTENLMVLKSVLRSWIVLNVSRKWVLNPQKTNWSRTKTVESRRLQSLLSNSKYWKHIPTLANLFYTLLIVISVLMLFSFSSRKNKSIRH